jgi:uncharacterized protein YbjT (DUF2867 family)
MNHEQQNITSEDLILVVGGTGKTGRRVTERLTARGLRVRAVSRSTEVRFDWQDSSTWDAALEGAVAVYVTFSPDLAVEWAPAAIEDFVSRAQARGVRKLVLLSGRGEAAAQRCERIVLDTNADWCVVRASWFDQNFSESIFLEPLRAGTLMLPAGEVGEPFVDVEDIADVVVAALTEAGHEGQIYEVTGPEALTFAEATAAIARATGRELEYQQIPLEACVNGLREQGVPGDVVEMIEYLFGTVLDGRNVAVHDGVQRALGRPARSFDEFAQRLAASGVWDAEEVAR